MSKLKERNNVYNRLYQPSDSILDLPPGHTYPYSLFTSDMGNSEFQVVDFKHDYYIVTSLRTTFILKDKVVTQLELVQNDYQANIEVNEYNTNSLRFPFDTYNLTEIRTWLALRDYKPPSQSQPKPSSGPPRPTQPDHTPSQQPSATSPKHYPAPH